MAGQDVFDKLEIIYAEVVHWRPNIFTIPLGAAGKKLVEEITRLVTAFAEGSALESVAFLALMTLPHLLLQKPSQSATHRQQVECLQRRLQTWLDGDFDELWQEGSVIQDHLNRRPSRRKDQALDKDHETSMARVFARMMTQGKVKAAQRLLSQDRRGGVLDLDTVVSKTTSSSAHLHNDQHDQCTVRDVLKQKHPDAQPADDDALLREAPPRTHEVLFENLDGAIIRSIALHCQGSAGPSGLDATSWRRMCTMYRGTSGNLCSAVAMLAKRIATMHLDPSILKPFIACRLVPLAKNPGVRPIGIGEVLRRLVGKAILQVVGNHVRFVAGCTQLCARQKSGCEVAVHAMRELFERDEVEGVLLIDATNAFNTLNREAMLHNIQILCPALAKSVVNTYRSPAQLFVGGETILSKEGTTQGDPLSTIIYALATIPLIRSLQKDQLSQTWFADDAGAGSDLRTLHSWWSDLQEHGPKYGYLVNPPKSWLVTKEPHVDKAWNLFGASGVQITTDGRPLLGAPLGSDKFKSAFIDSQVSVWVDEVKTLAKFATTQPHAAHAAFTHGLAGKWNYLTRACEGVQEHLQPLEEAIRTDLLKSITGRSINDQERELLGLPSRLGGIGVADPQRDAADNYVAASAVTRPLVDHVLHRASGSIGDAFAEQVGATSKSRRRRQLQHQDIANSLKEQMEPRTQKAMTLAQERGASTWLTALPLTSQGFSLSKSEYRDALCLRYGWTPERLPSHCSCGKVFTADHALSCSCGGYLGVRHNEVRDLLCSVMRETCHNVSIEPQLLPLDGERFRSTGANTANDARVDIKANGFWNGSRHECAYFDVRVFYPHAHSYRSMQVPVVYRNHERQKRNEYEERIREVDKGSFTPLVFSSSGGAGPAATTMLKRLANIYAEKKTTSYSEAIAWLRCRLAFALLRSSVLCLRGARAPKGRDYDEQLQPDLALSSGQVHI